MTDVLLVRLGSTAGLRAAEDELAGALARAGADVAQVQAHAPREVRTFALTDLAWAVAARRAATAGIAAHAPHAVLYSTTTAALLWPRPGAIRFDALAAATRPGRHGAWQRPVERRRLAQASVLVPQAAGALEGVAAPSAPVVVPVPVEASGPLDGARDLAAITYGANWRKKGLDRVLAAWRTVVGGDTLAGAGGAPAGALELVVAGVSAAHVADAWRAGGGGTEPLPASVSVTGPLAPAGYRALLRRARVFVTAPRREDYGIAQLEALADGCTLVTTAAPGPYAALPLARALDPRWVVADDAGTPALAAALRGALAAGAVPDAARRSALLAPFTRAAADRAVAEELLPRLLR
jgi:Glycosyl transferases group 1